MSLLNFEKKYRKSLENQQKILEKIYEEISSKAPISLKRRDITKAILFRMKAYYDNQDRIKKFLNKRISQAASDFFVEAVIFYLKLVFEKKGIDFEIHSEKRIMLQKGALKPDISVWNNNEVVAIIECKTNFSRNRNNWEREFKKREDKLKAKFKSAKIFLLVLTSEGWPGFSKNDKKVGSQYFTLSSKWPTKISPVNFDEVIINPIEDLFKQIISLGRPHK